MWGWNGQCFGPNYFGETDTRSFNRSHHRISELARLVTTLVFSQFMVEFFAELHTNVVVDFVLRMDTNFGLYEGW